MSRHLRRAALAAAAAVALSAAATGRVSYRNVPSSLDFSPSSSATNAAAPGHLALARAHPDLRGLDAFLTSESFLLDATRALSAAALGSRPLPVSVVRRLRSKDIVAALIAEVESEDGAKEVLRARIQVAVYAAKDGRFDDALDALVRVAAERPFDAGPLLCAAGICYFAGLIEEGNRWVSGIPDVVRRDNMSYLHKGVLAATVGSAPGAVAGFEALVGLAAFEVMEAMLGTKVKDGDISLFKMMLLLALLWRGVVAGKYKDYCTRKFTVTTAQQRNDLSDLDQPISRYA